jgi:hypothetical protein
MRYVNCPKCGSSNKQTAADCYGCGTPIQETPKADSTPNVEPETDLGGIGPGRMFGSLVCWFLPDRMFQEVATDQTSWQDYVSHIIGVSLTWGILIQMVVHLEDINDSGSAAGVSVAAALFGVWIPIMLFSFGLSWACDNMLNDHKVNGTQIRVPSGSVSRVHLHIHAVPLTALLVAAITGNGVAWLLFAVAVFWSVHLEARALHFITGESRSECYKMAAVLYAVVGGSILGVAFLGYLFG